MADLKAAFRAAKEQRGSTALVRRCKSPSREAGQAAGTRRASSAAHGRARCCADACPDQGAQGGQAAAGSSGARGQGACAATGPQSFPMCPTVTACALHLCVQAAPKPAAAPSQPSQPQPAARAVPGGALPADFFQQQQVSSTCVRSMPLSPLSGATPRPTHTECHHPCVLQAPAPPQASTSDPATAAQPRAAAAPPAAAAPSSKPSAPSAPSAAAGSSGAAGAQAPVPEGFFADRETDAKVRGIKLPDEKDKEDEFQVCGVVRRGRCSVAMRVTCSGERGAGARVGAGRSAG